MWAFYLCKGIRSFSFLTSKASFKMVKPKYYSKFYEKGLLSKRGSNSAIRFSFNKDTSRRENNNSLIPLGDISYKDTTSKAKNLHVTN